MNNEFRCTYKGQKIDMGIIETVERKLGFIFPDSYKNYVINNNGGHIEGTYIDESGIKEIISFRFLAFEEQILEQANILKDCTPKNIIPFAADAGGNYYCFDYKENLNKPTIVVLDHESMITQEEYNEFDPQEIDNMTLEEIQREDSITEIFDSFDIITNNLI